MNKILKSEPIPVSVILISVFLLVGGVWLFSMLFSYALATENGLEYINPFRKDRFIAWGNIVEVKRPLFKIPNDYSYVISKENTEKIILIRSMKNYRQMIGLIKEKAPNLRTCNFQKIDTSLYFLKKKKGGTKIVFKEKDCCND